MSDDATFDTGRQVVGVDPKDFVHLRHVQGDDHPRLARRTQEGAGDACAPTKRNHRHIVVASWTRKGETILESTKEK